MKAVLVDTGFIIALYDRADQYHVHARELQQQYLAPPGSRLLLPWPILYEAISTRMARRQVVMSAIARDWGRLERDGRLNRLSDSVHRDDCLQQCFRETEREKGKYRPLSLVDRVLRRILVDPDVRFDVFITFNPGDFVDVPLRSHRLMVS